ncbi:MAG: sigma-70 family RNA polymerase sigma factor [Myxococcales bacterium]|nr:sigma-70 family RNA polymerase sigma factor [Myxococcales bacterium]
MTHDLARAFVAALPAGVAAPDGDAVAEVLARLAASGAERWPEVDAEPAAFAAYLARRVDVEDLKPCIEQLEGLSTDDLYIAWACLAGQPSAIAAVETRLLRKHQRVLAKRGFPQTVIDEAMQRVREQVFVGRSDRPATLGQFAGRSSLDGWLRIVVIRAALELVRSEQAKPDSGTGGDQLLDRIADSQRSPELALLKGRYRAAFADALRQALASLDKRQRTLLRQYYVFGLNFNEMARIYAVDRSRVSRWVSRIRDEIFDGTRQRVMDQLSLAAPDYESVLRVVGSDLELSLSALLLTTPPAPDGRDDGDGGDGGDDG